MKYSARLLSAGLIVCGWILLAPATAYPACDELVAEVDAEAESTSAVAVGFKMIRCEGRRDRRCASLNVRMSADSYEELGRPKQVKWFYTVNEVKICLYPYGSLFPVCTYREFNRTVVADFVYDQENNEYYLVKRGRQYFKGVGFVLNSVCLTRGGGDDYAESCEKVRIVGNVSGGDYVTRQVNFSPLVERDAEAEVSMMYMPVFMPFMYY